MSHFNNIQFDIATALKRERPGKNWSQNKWTQWRLDVKAVANAIRLTDNQFNVQEFINFTEN